jgi:TPR repeat protein
MHARSVLAIILVLATGATAEAAGPEPKHWVARRLAADHHLQIEVKGVDGPASGVGPCKIEGLVARAFRSKNNKFHPGSGVVFFQACSLGEAMSHSGEILWPLDALRGARVLEVFLRQGRGGMETADQGEGMAVLAAATDAPTVQDDPKLVRESRESISSYEIDAAVRRNNIEAALTFARDPDPSLKARLLAQVAAKAPAVLDEALAALRALPTPAERLAAGMSMGETLVMGGATAAALTVATEVERDLPAATDRTAVLLNLFGVRMRAGDHKGALASLAQIADAATRRDRLAGSPHALKGFGANPASAEFIERLLVAAEVLPADRSREAIVTLSDAALTAAMAQAPAMAARIAEPPARRGHAPSATALAVLYEQGAGVPRDTAQSARWYAVAAAGFGGPDSERRDARKRLAGFSAADRLAAARLLLQAQGKSPMAPLGAVSPDRLVEMAGR